MNQFKYTLLLAGFILFLSSCRDETPVVFNQSDCPSGDITNLHLLLGNPSEATTNENNPNNYLMQMEEYAISYSRDRAIPNWVSWHLSDEWFEGNGTRQNDFRANPFFPADWNVPNSESFSGTGFNRGHNCPSADRLCSDNFNSATFFMSNMIPQAPLHNQETWKHWECYFRYLVDDDKEMYVVMGNYGQGGLGDNGYAETFEDENGLVITVPESIWKVAILIPKGDDNDLDFIDAQSTVIAIDIPNTNTVANFEWDDPQFITTVDEIEQRMGTGFDLFSNLPSNVQDALESTTHSTDPSFTPCW